MKHSTTYTW